MSRWISALLLSAVPLAAWAAGPQDKPQLQRRDRKTPVKPQTGVPPEEDESVATREYGFNPVQAQKEISALRQIAQSQPKETR